MAVVKSPLPEDVQKTVGEALQGAVVDLVDLTLVGKQVHWTLVGRDFRSLHLQLDDVVASARDYTDKAAERAVTIGTLPDGRAGTVGGTSAVAQPAADWVHVDDAVPHFVGVLEGIVGRMRERIEATEDDEVTQDLLIDITGGLEEHYWMFQAENVRR